MGTRSATADDVSGKLAALVYLVSAASDRCCEHFATESGLPLRPRPISGTGIDRSGYFYVAILITARLGAMELLTSTLVCLAHYYIRRAQFGQP